MASNEASRPAKRMRISPADGFSKSKAPAQMARLDFISAFDDVSSTSNSTHSRKSTLRLPSVPPGGSSPAVMRVLKPPVFKAAQGVDRTLPHKSALQTVGNVSPMRVHKPPNISSFLNLNEHKDSTSNNKSFSIITHRPVLPSAGNKGIERAPILRQLCPPDISALFPKKNVPLKTLPPPPVFPPAPGPSKYMTAISKTRVALATDPHTESGAATLLSLFLQQHGTGYVNPIEREMTRGLLQSPEKAVKYKSSKFIRGGLADRASKYLSGTQTAMMLWQKEMENHAQHSRRVAPHLRVRVVQVSCPARPDKPRLSQLALVQCRVTKGADAVGAAYLEDIALLLDFKEPSPSNKFNNAGDLHEGCTVEVWRPWCSLQAPPEIDLDVRPSEPPSATPDFRTIRRSRSVIMCSRFCIRSN